MKSASTLVALVGGVPSLSTLSDRATNATTVSVAAGTDLLERHARVEEAWRQATKRSSLYTIVDADPLDVVVSQWSARLQATQHDLELAIGLVTHQTVMTDFYLVDIDLGQPQMDWYFDLVARTAPDRVVPVAMTVAGVLEALGHLPHGRSLPTGPDLASQARAYVPVGSI